MQVLIVPLWNWNFVVAPSPMTVQKVLIVPLWNWNGEVQSDDGRVSNVLIVPLWNWNDRYFSGWKGEPRSNCTFMELKS